MLIAILLGYLVVGFISSSIIYTIDSRVNSKTTYPELIVSNASFILLGMVWPFALSVFTIINVGFRSAEYIQSAKNPLTTWRKFLRGEKKPSKHGGIVA